MSGEFIFQDNCSYCRENNCYYPFYLHGNLDLQYTCKDCLQRAWDHYRKYKSCDDWQPELKAKTYDDFFKILIEQREKSIEKYFFSRTQKEVIKRLEMEDYQKMLDNKIDTILEMKIPDNKIITLELELYPILQKNQIELWQLQNGSNNLIFSCDKKIPEDILRTIKNEILEFLD